MSYFTKRYHTPGTAPGTLAEPPPETKKPLRIQLVDYTEEQFVDRAIDDPEDCREYLARPTTTWIHVEGHAEPDTLQQLGTLFGMHPLALEDVVNTGQRPKVDVYDDQLFVVLSLPVDGEAGPGTEQVSLYCGPRFIVSFHEGPRDPFEMVRKRLSTKSGKIRSRSVDYLLYALVDVVVDEAFPVLEAFGEAIEVLEDELLARPERSTLQTLHHVKRELLLLRRMLWPQREVLNVLLRDEHPLIHDETKVYFRDCYDHTIQIMDLLETYRDMTAGMLDVYLSSVSNRMNEVMKVLTVIATTFIPLTFIAGVYGMNFGSKSDSPWNMPELNWYYGYPLIWAVMLAIGIGMLTYFRRKKWF